MFKWMLNISSVKEIRPYFEDKYGEPDTLPAQFTDPLTGYCQPYPHWKLPLPKQPVWVPTFVLHFQSTIPNDQSETSTRLRGLTDELIVILLHDGPFKTAQAAWHDMKKMAMELQAMRSIAHQYQRADRVSDWVCFLELLHTYLHSNLQKATVRSGYIKEILSLQGPEWDYLSHPGYMLQDESDDEGVLVTKRPAHQATWVGL
jgi:hypothetical protein